MRWNKRETTATENRDKEVERLRETISSLYAKVQALTMENERLEEEVNYFRLSSIPISLEEKFAFWELHEKRVQRAQEAEEAEKQAEMDRLLDELDK